MSGSVLLAETVVAVQPTLVRRLRSIERAAVLQQLHYGLQNGEAWEDEDGERWLPVRYADLARQIGLTPDQVRRAIEGLEREEVIASCQPEAYNRRKSYRIDYGHEVLAAVNPPDRSGKSATSEAARAPDDPLFRDEKDHAGATPPPDGKESKPKAERPRNVIYDAIASVYPTSTKSEQKLIGMAAAELAKLKPPPAPEIIVRAARWCLQEWPGCTPRALTQHWSRAVNESRRSGGGSGRSGEVVRCSVCDRLAPDCRCPNGPSAPA